MRQINILNIYLRLFSVNIQLSKTVTKTLKTECNKNTLISELEDIISRELQIDSNEIRYLVCDTNTIMLKYKRLNDYNIIDSNNSITLKYNGKNKDSNHSTKTKNPGNNISEQSKYIHYIFFFN